MSPDFPPLQPSKSFIQTSKSTFKNIPVQNQSRPNTISTLPSSSSSPSFSISQYFKKPKTLEIAFLEPEYSYEEIPKILPYIFPQGVTFNSNDPLKTRQFYEFILLDMDSVEIIHNFDKNNPHRIAFSKCQILIVMTIADWNKKNPSLARHLVNLFHPMSYNYIDYMDAWYNMFYLQSYQHSWFIQFSRNCYTKFPAWFKKWWTFFGLLDSIFPPEIQEKFNFYKSKTSSQSITQSRLLTSCSRLRISWILTWNIIKKQNQPHPFPLSLFREFNIKW